MSCSLGTYPSTRQVAPAAPVGALRAAAERVQNTHAGSTAPATFDTRRPNYLLDVPISAKEVERWEQRWQEARNASGASSSSSSVAAAKGYFQTAAAAFAARNAANSVSATAAARPVEVSTAPPTHHLAPFPPFVFSSVKTLPMTQLLKLRRQWLPHRQRFPVHQQRMGFLDAVLNHAVVALVGPAGSGRTLQVPIVLSETEVLKRRRLVVVSANATAARLTVLRLREERGEDVTTSRTVAAALPNFVEVQENTSVVVTTAEVLLRQLLCDPCLEDVGCVVLDDAHLRSESTELCLALLRDILTAQQQQQQQQLQVLLAAGGSGLQDSRESADGSANTADATRSRRLHLVLNCPDEATATTLLSYLAPSRCKATTFTLQPSAILVTNSTTLYLEETVQWLLKCEKEGSCTVRDGGSGGAESTVESALLAYAENVDAVARIMAAGDADFTQPAAFRQYWLALIRECVDHFDRADRQARSARCPGAPLPVILIVAPNNYYVHVITAALRAAAESRANGAEEDAAAAAAAPRVFSALADDALFAHFVAAAQRTVVTDAQQRWVVVATSELSQTVLPSSVDVGLVVDCARSTHTPVDAATMADTCTTEYSSITQLRYRRRLAKMTTTLTVGDASESSGSASAVLSPVVIQLIPKSVLHSAQHRRLNADPAQHVVFRLPFHRYVQLYQVLQAREEGLLAQRAAVAASLGGNPNAPQSSSNGGEGGSTVTAKISSLLAALLIGVPAATANKYETVRRVMTSVEAYLRAAAHLAVDSDVGSIRNGRLALQPMGVLSLCLPVPFPVSRLLVVGALLRPSVAALTAIGALWCCSDLLSLRGVGAVRAADAPDAAREDVAEQAALLGEARLFFSRDSLSDVVAAFHVYQMWCTVRGSKEAEHDFLAECGVSQEVLTAVFDTQVGLCAMLRSFGLLAAPPGSASVGAGGEAAPSATSVSSSVDRAESPEEKALRASITGYRSTADAAAQLRAALGTAMTALSQDVSSSRALHACVTAALYPSCVVPTGEDGTGLLYDAVSAAVNASAAASSAGDVAGSTLAGRRVASFAADSLLADTAQGVKAAGKPFLFLAKAVADEASREAAGATNSTTAVVVEQLNPLHEAAALVFCGHTEERPRRAPLRCRGWSSMLTRSWRETRRARGLPPVAQLPPTSITPQPYDTVHCQQVVRAMDASFSLTMRATTSRWLQQLRAQLRHQLSQLVRGGGLSATGAAYPAMAAELAEAWAWWERRHAQGKEWLREERVVVAHQQDSKEKDKGADRDGEEKEAATGVSAAQAAAHRQRLYCYHAWQLQPGTPAVVTVPTGADRRAAAAAKSAAAAATAADAATADAKAAEEDTSHNHNEDADANAEGALPATYSGPLPSAEVDHIFRKCAKSMAARGTREAEARLLRDDPKMFFFLNPENPYHEYYLFLLRQAAPDMEVLGDNLEELITFLEDVEVELRKELGYDDAAAAAAGGDGAEADASGGGGGGVLGDAVPNTGVNGGNSNNSGMWGGSGVYEVHDVVDGYGDGDDGLYSGDGGGLQLESAAVNLRKNAGPTLAEQIEHTRRAQANPSSTPHDSAYQAATSVFPSPLGATSMLNVPGGAAGAAGQAATPFVSSNSGETLADKLKAMQMAAMQGNSASSTSNNTNNNNGSGGRDDNNRSGIAATSEFAVPQVTAQDLLAAINFSGEDATASLTADQGQPQSNYSAPGTDSLFQAPTAEELMALLGNTSTPPPSNLSAADGGGVLGAMNYGDGVLNMMSANPLSRPPPAIPAKAVEERAPSVLVYPIPNCRQHGGNVRLMLAKSLGEALNMRVGPTVIVGRVARVDVPNRNVEARALALKSFQCAGQTAYLLRNDRIIDDTAREQRERHQQQQPQRRPRQDERVEGGMGGRDSTAADYRERRRHRSEDELNDPTSAAGVGVATATDPTSADAFVDPSAYGAAPTATAAATSAVRIGVLSSSEDEEEDSDSDSDSSSSSSASSV